MCGGDDEPVGYQRSAAEEQPVQRHGRVPRVFADIRVRAADNPPVVITVVVIVVVVVTVTIVVVVVVPKLSPGHVGYCAPAIAVANGGRRRGVWPHRRTPPSPPVRLGRRLATVATIVVTTAGDIGQRRRHRAAAGHRRRPRGRPTAVRRF